MSRTTKWLLALTGTSAYFAAATVLRSSHVDPTPKGAIVVRLYPPFERHIHAAVSRQSQPQDLQDNADDDTVEFDVRSPAVIYEDGIRLGPAHDNFAAVNHLGMGRFTHWRDSVVFSASDNSDPNKNGRRYWLVLPEPARKQADVPCVSFGFAVRGTWARDWPSLSRL